MSIEPFRAILWRLFFNPLAKSDDSILVRCWAHSKRKYIDAEEHFPKEAGNALDLIGQLHAVEREAGSDADKGGTSVRIAPSQS